MSNAGLKKIELYTLWNEFLYVYFILVFKIRSLIMVLWFWMYLTTDWNIFGILIYQHDGEHGLLLTMSLQPYRMSEFWRRQRKRLMWFLYLSLTLCILTVSYTNLILLVFCHILEIPDQNAASAVITCIHNFPVKVNKSYNKTWIQFKIWNSW